jgi:amylosucrase
MRRRWAGIHSAHRDFLLQFFSRPVPGSFAKGAIFQYNPETGDGRTSGSAASLCGIERALADDDDVHLELACARLELLYAVVYAYGGIPLLYMGDELGVAQRPVVSRRPGEGRRQPVDAPTTDGLGGRRAPRTTRHAGGAPVRDVRRASLRIAHPSVPSTRPASEKCCSLARAVTCSAFTRTHPAHGTFTMLANFGHGTAVVRSGRRGSARRLRSAPQRRCLIVDGIAQLAPTATSGSPSS